MYERFSDRARLVMNSANVEAQKLGHEYIGTEHILLGMCRRVDCNAVRIMESLLGQGQTVSVIDCKVRGMLTPVDAYVMGKLPQTPDAKKIIEDSLKIARLKNHNYVGSEHMLAAMTLQPSSVAGCVLLATFPGLTTDRIMELADSKIAPSTDRGQPILPNPVGMTYAQWKLSMQKLISQEADQGKADYLKKMIDSGEVKESPRPDLSWLDKISQPEVLSIPPQPTQEQVFGVDERQRCLAILRQEMETHKSKGNVREAACLLAVIKKLETPPATETNKSE